MESQKAEQDPSTRIQQDEVKLKEIVETLTGETSKIKKVIRLGKQIPLDSQPAAIKPRPIKVIYENEDSKNEVLRTTRNLKDTKYNKVYIVQDLTVREREHHKMLLAERDKKRLQGCKHE